MTKFRFVIEAFSKTQCLQVLLGRQILELLGLVSRLGDCPMGAVTAQHVANYVLDPNASDDQVSIRTQLVREFWRWCGNEGVDASETELESTRNLIEGASGPVLSLEQAKTLLAQVGRPWTIPYLAPRLFLGIDHSAALGFIRGADAPGITYPIIMEQAAEGNQRHYAVSSALSRWLEPYRYLRPDEPCIQDPLISDYLAQQASNLGLHWDEWLPARTYAAYRLALTGDVRAVARQTGFPESLISLAFTGLVAHQDALPYFDLSPRTCRRHNWDQEVAQWLDWHTGGFLFGASLAVAPAGVPSPMPG
jgi:hypothetical protein